MEEWRAIPGFEGLYEVSDLGRMRSLDRVARCRNRWGTYSDRRFPMKVLRTPITDPETGYPSVNLWAEGVPSRQNVHNLVLLAFKGPIPMGEERLHKNDIRTDNRLSNLEYGTREKNNAQKVANGKSCRGTEVHFAIVDEEIVREIRKEGARSTQQELGDRYGICRSAVGAILRRENWRHV